jgi:hypothetical protein
MSRNSYQNMMDKMTIRLFMALLSLLIASITTNGCIPPLPMPNDTMRIVTASDTIPADGISTVELLANMPTGASASSTITFTTNAGSFYGALNATPQTVTVPDPNDSSYALLISGNNVVDSVLVTSESNNYQATKVVTFTTSYPQLLTLTSNVYQITAASGDSARLTINLSKSQGMVSNHFPVNLFYEGLATPDSITPNVDLPPIVYVDGQSLSFGLHSTNNPSSGSILIKAVYPTSSLSLDTVTMQLSVTE